MTEPTSLPTVREVTELSTQDILDGTFSKEFEADGMQVVLEIEKAPSPENQSIYDISLYDADGNILMLIGMAMTDNGPEFFGSIDLVSTTTQDSQPILSDKTIAGMIATCAKMFELKSAKIQREILAAVRFEPVGEEDDVDQEAAAATWERVIGPTLVEVGFMHTGADQLLTDQEWTKTYTPN